MLWYAFFAPLFAWFVQLNASYMVGTYACPVKMWLLHGITIIAAVIAGSGLFISGRDWRKTKKTISAVVFFLAGLFLLIILVGEIANVMLETCQ